MLETRSRSFYPHTHRRHDAATASPTPEKPTVAGLMVGAVGMGLAQAAFSVGFWCYGADITGLSDFADDDLKTQVAVFLQVSLSVELLIFACRAPAPVFLTKMPSPALMGSVMVGNLITTCLCFFGWVVAAPLPWRAVWGVWAYDVVAFFALDLLKVSALWAFDGLELGKDALPPPENVFADDQKGLGRELSRGSAGSLHDRLSDRLSMTLARASASSKRGPSLARGRASEAERPSLATTLLPQTPGNIAQVMRLSA